MSIADDEHETSLGDSDQLSPFTLVRPVDRQVPVIFASPHSGQHYPQVLRDNLKVPLIDLRRTQDAFVDELFANAPAFGATLISATHARSYVDLNRDPRELDPEMFEAKLPGPAAAPSARVQAGLGCIPRIGARGEAIYAKKLTLGDGQARLEGIHGPYHRALATEIAALHQQFGCALLIDCHSMPSRQPGRGNLADIVLGDRFGSSCTNRLTNLTERTFRRLGLTVTRNAPYAGGYTTRRYGRPKRHVHTLQIEINRALYMDEVAVEPLAGIAGFRAIVDEMIGEVCALADRLRP